MVGFLQVQCRADDGQADQPVLPDGQALHHAVGGENVVCIRLVVHVGQAQERCVRAQLQGVVAHQLQLAFHAAGHAREVAALLLPVAVADAAVIGETDDDKQRQANKQEHRIGKGNPRGASKAHEGSATVSFGSRNSPSSLKNSGGNQFFSRKRKDTFHCYYTRKLGFFKGLRGKGTIFDPLNHQKCTPTERIVPCAESAFML